VDDGARGHLRPGEWRSAAQGVFAGAWRHGRGFRPLRFNLDVLRRTLWRGRPARFGGLPADWGGYSVRQVEAVLLQNNVVRPWGGRGVRVLAMREFSEAWGAFSQISEAENIKGAFRNVFMRVRGFSFPCPFVGKRSNDGVPV